METGSRKRIIPTGAFLGLALALSGCSSVQPKFDSAVDSVKSFFRGGAASDQNPVERSSEAEAMYEAAQQARAADAAGRS